MSEADLAGVLRPVRRAGIRDRQRDPSAVRAGDHRQTGRRPPGAIRHAVARQTLVAGRCGDISSYCFLALALDYGSVLLVMSLQVTALLFAMPIYARLTGHPITRSEWMWAVVLVVALALVIAVGIRWPARSGRGQRLAYRGPRDGSGVGVVFAGGPDLEGPSGRGGAAGGGVRFVVGVVRGADEGHCGSDRSRRRPLAACMGALSLGPLRSVRNDLSPVRVSRRLADRLPADDHRREARGSRCTRGPRAQRDPATPKVPSGLC